MKIMMTTVLVALIPSVCSMVGIVWVAKINANNKELMKVIEVQRKEIQFLRLEIERLTEKLNEKFRDWRDMI